MRLVICVCLLAGIAFTGGDGLKTRSNALTPREAADGWLLLFDGDTTFGWSVAPASSAVVKDSVLTAAGKGSLQTTAAFAQFALEFQCRFTGANAHDDVRLNFADKSVGIAVPKDNPPRWCQAKLLVTDKKYRLTLTSARGTFPDVTGDLANSAATPIAFTLAEGVTLELRDVTLVPLGMKPLFNGKNLDGWKVFAGDKYKSKFSVNSKLELQVKDGPGDLQTEGKFADFLLQIDCISHGDRLNSGVFFRCIDGQYQNGYEAQIHNGFTDKPAKEYLVDEYDPQTRRLIGKQKVQSTAIDYGTGAIYRRVPARKQVAKDREWFTMTVLAHGNHIATWVSGVQVLDWFDNRPLSDNPRNGCRLEAGHLSIQGHDPTTDLSFRNIKIAEYAAGK
jgi:hypothetical protein